MDLAEQENSQDAGKQRESAQDMTQKNEAGGQS